MQTPLCTCCGRAMVFKRSDRRYFWCANCGYRRRFHDHLDGRKQSLARIYVLVDPTTGAGRYIGQTVRSLADRLCEHIEDALLNPDHGTKQQWLYGLYQRGLTACIEELAQVPYLDRDQAEHWWIAEYRRRGSSLLNVEPGGGEVTSWDLFAARQHRINPATQARSSKATVVTSTTDCIALPEWAAGADYTLVVVSRLLARTGARSSQAGAESLSRLVSRTGRDYRVQLTWSGPLAREEAAFRAIGVAIDNLLMRIQAYGKSAELYSLRLLHHYEQILHQVEGRCPIDAHLLRLLCEQLQQKGTQFRSLECVWVGFREAMALIGPLSDWCP